MKIDPMSILANITLVNYLFVQQNALVGVAWTLVVEMMYYILLLCVMPLIRRCTWYAICVELTFVALVIITARSFGPSYFLVAVSVSFIPIILLGQIFWAIHTKRIPLWASALFGSLAWMLYVSADLLSMGRIDHSYNLALAYAVLLFGIGLVAEPKLRQKRWITYLSERSYSIYLIHGVVLFPALDLLWKVMPLWLALPIGLTLTSVVVEFCYRFVERPSNRLGSRLARRIAPRGHRDAAQTVPAFEYSAAPDRRDWNDVPTIPTIPISRVAVRPRQSGPSG